mmetsp:Transcript_29289/g.71410  ORF Transcript_29289/g.71410 Transcript_29289/m.71410 type:complete len:102 (-) Transcript_29289:1058-1363(-)
MFVVRYPLMSIPYGSMEIFVLLSSQVRLGVRRGSGGQNENQMNEVQAASDSAAILLFHREQSGEHFFCYLFLTSIVDTFLLASQVQRLIRSFLNMLAINSK